MKRIIISVLLIASFMIGYSFGVWSVMKSYHTRVIYSGVSK
jgi:hypothetical protein